MTKHLLTLATPEIRSQCEIFINNQREYARVNDYEYFPGSDVFWKHMHPSYSKVHEIEAHLKSGADVVVWVDADVAFTNFKKDLANLLTGDTFMAAYQQQNWTRWVYLCAGITVWRNTPEALAYIAKWIDRIENGSPSIIQGERVKMQDAARQPVMQGKPWEQWYMDELTRETKWHNIRACNADEIGCFSSIWHDGVEWKKGMPTVHFAGDATWERRAEVFKTIYEPQIVR